MGLEEWLAESVARHNHDLECVVCPPPVDPGLGFEVRGFGFEVWGLGLGFQVWVLESLA